jgi:PAS domain S-box-containing protein
VNALQEENDKLRGAIRSHLKDGAEELLKTCEVEIEDSLLTSDPDSATKILDDPDYTLVKALQTAQQNFVITDPTLPDNPIVYASGGFLNLTGYKMDQILGRNCRFLQGPDTDPGAVDKIRRAIEEGTDGSVCLLNYRADGSTFWNQFFIAALRGADGNIVNYVGVQCRVSEDYAREVLKKESVSSTLTGASSSGPGLLKQA